MKCFLLLFILLSTVDGYPQCPTAIPLTVLPDNCLGTTLTVSPVAGMDYSKITWYNGTNPVSVVDATIGSSTGITVAGGNGKGAAANQLYPDGLFVDGVGNIYVVDVDNSRVQKWAPGATSGVTVAGGNGAGNAANQLNYPLGLAVATNGDLYIADASNDRVQKWTPGASSGITVAGGNGQGAAANQFYDPTRIVIDNNNGDLYIGDSENNRVQKWTSGATSGITVAGGNGQGGAANQLYGVYGLALDKVRNLYVSDNGNNRIQKWAPGAASGITVIGGNGFGNAANQLGGPAGMFIDSDDNLYVGDYFNERVMKYAPGASSGVLVAGGNGTGNAPNQFFEPECSFLDGYGNLYVSDAFNNRVQKWTVSTINGSYIPATPGTYTALVQTFTGCTVTSSPQIVNPIASPTLIITTPTTQVTSCSPVNFKAVITDGGSAPSFQWQINGKNEGTDASAFTSNQIADGDVISCILTSNAPCAPTGPATSNILKMVVTGGASPAVSISSASASICSGTPILFSAVLTNGGIANSYQWKVNGNITGKNSADFNYLLPNNGDTVRCEVAVQNSCMISISNNIVLKVYATPTIGVGEIFVTIIGQGVQLNPVITGNIQSYAWTPGITLSDSTIRNPIANPPRNTVYQLKIISEDGCESMGKISVEVSSAIKIPNAFTPNGDGKNDEFNVVGGTVGSRIEQFVIFNRWGQIVYEVKNKTPDNNGGGWKGDYNGKAADEGAYVYFIDIVLPDGTKQVYKGTVLLIR